MVSLSGEGRKVLIVLGAVLLVSLGIYFVYPIRVVALVLLLTMLLAIILGAPVDYLARKGLSRVWATLAVIAAAFALVPVTVRIVMPIIADQVRQLTSDLPAIVAEVSSIVGDAQDALGLGESTIDLLDPEQLPQTLLGYLSSISPTTIAATGSSTVTTPTTWRLAWLA